MAEGLVRYMDGKDVNYYNIRSHHVVKINGITYHLIKTERRTSYIPLTGNVRSITIDTEIDKG